ncbi:MAG: type IV pilus assembly protein PilM [Methylacidiphilales bacterium]|nr:type IV pilus assembly protein PilM [Candidatus Methylacidiphilales bacterium]
MFDFLTKGKGLIGIDISNFTVKLMEFSKNGNNYKIEHFGILPLEEGMVVNSKIVKIEEVADKIRDLVSKYGASTKQAAFAISGSDAITKIAQFSSLASDEEILNLIQTYPDQYLPFPIEDMAIDFKVLGPSSVSPDLSDVIITGAKITDISTIVETAQQAGLTPAVIDVSTYAIENIYPLVNENFPDYGRNKAIALIDIGGINTNATIFDNGDITFARVANFGGKKLTDEIMSKYGVSYNDAGRLKREGGLPDNYETELLNPFKEDIVNQINRLLRFYYNNNHVETVDFIALAGGCSNIDGISELVESRLGIHCNVLDPFSGMSCAFRVSKKQLQLNSSSLLVAGSLAMRAFK